MRKGLKASIRRIFIVLALALTPVAVLYYAYETDELRKKRSADLISALQDSRWPDASRLLKEGADPNARNGQSEPDPSLWQRLTSMFRDQPKTVQLGDRALSIAVHNGSAELTTELLDRGAKLRDPAGTGMDDELVSAASSSGNVQMVRLLLDKGLSANGARGFRGPIECAIEGGHPYVVRLLVERGANIKVAATDIGWDERKKAPLLKRVSLVKFARSRGNRAILDILKRAGAPE
jgi:ankyrin repeat protein